LPRFAVYLVLSFGLHNYQVKQAWEQYKIEGDQLRAENSTLKEALQDESWLEAVEKKIRAACAGQKTLSKEMQSKLKSIAEASVVKETESVADQLSDAVKLEVGIPINKGDGSSGRVI
jgi:hypothetical protein